jgi:D-glycero-D-manno-heptose 1,7-bisphosphate phosphatase
LNKAVFLDRDGVLNKSNVRSGRPYAPTSLAEFEILPGVPEAIADLHAAGFKLVVVTNQPDISTGLQTKATVHAMHDLLRQSLVIDDIKYCSCIDTDNCPRRKPAPGMLVEAAEEWNIDLARSYMVGDRWRDIDAGKAAGCTSIFIDFDYDEKLQSKPDHTVASLQEATRCILQKTIV